jgi:S-adenosylmethionine-dependent methyltransferase
MHEDTFAGDDQHVPVGCKLSEPTPIEGSRFATPCARQYRRTAMETNRSDIPDGDPAQSSAKVQRYYDAYDEWGRLEAPAGQFEFLRTMFLLQRSLPAESRILDLGGGPGRYAIALARRNHRVSLADISPAQLDIARKKIRAADLLSHVERVDLVDATDLGIYDDAEFDAVVALGPFYHLTSQTRRTQAATEINRVTRSGGLVFTAFMPPIVGVTGLIHRTIVDPLQVAPEAYKRVLDDGEFENSRDRGFQEGWYARSDEIESLFADAGYEKRDVVSIRGIAYDREEAILDLRVNKPDHFAGIMQALQQSARYHEVIATCGHALYIGERCAFVSEFPA